MGCLHTQHSTAHRTQHSTVLHVCAVRTVQYCTQHALTLGPPIATVQYSNYSIQHSAQHTPQRGAYSAAQCSARTLSKKKQCAPTDRAAQQPTYRVQYSSTAQYAQYPAVPQNSTVQHVCTVQYNALGFASSVWGKRVSELRTHVRQYSKRIIGGLEHAKQLDTHLVERARVSMLQYKVQYSTSAHTVGIGSFIGPGSPKSVRGWPCRGICPWTRPCCKKSLMALTRRQPMECKSNWVTGRS